MLPSFVFTIDFETTGIDPATCEVLEIGIVPASGPYIVSFIQPTKPIPPEASAVNHITQQDVEGAPEWGAMKNAFANLILTFETPVLVAHNADYERAVLGDFPEVDWICTYKCALRVWPEAPSHKNEVLRYWLGLPCLGRRYPQNSHSALHDAEVTQQILVKLLEKASLQQLIEWTKEPAMLPRIPFGMHFGKAWSDVPADYLQWILKQKDMREDVVHCAKKELERRRVGPTKH